MSFTTNNYDHFNDLMTKDWTVDGKTFNMVALGYSWGYNNNKRRLGVHKKGRYTNRIEISKTIFDINPNFKQFDNTIRHEIAHAIDYAMRGTSDHSWKWKRVARQVGCDAQRTAEIDNKPKSKYTLRCPNGHESVAHRKPKLSKSCAKCNPHRYDERYQFQVIQNY